MSTHDPQSGQPTGGKKIDSTGAPKTRTPIPADHKIKEEEIVFRQRRASPALRLAAWLLAFVLLLVVLGWALGTIL